MLRNVGLRKSVEQPVLDLNFAASQIGSNGAPDSRIDFSRGSNAWFVDSDGLVKKSPHNLLPYSEDFTNAVWAKTRCSISSNAGIAPDGTTTADKLVEDSSTNTHFLQEALTIASSTAFTFSVFLKAGERDHANIHMGEGQWKTGGYAALNVDLADGTVSVVNATYVDASSIEDYGNGWFRVSISSTSGSSQTTGVFRIFPTLSNFGTSYAGDGSSGIFVWGAQVSQHTTLPVDNPYIKTEGSEGYAARLDHDASWFMSAAQEQNLLEYSEMLDDSGWTKNSVTVTANAETDPLGGTTAEYIFATSPSGGFPSIQGSFDTKKGAVHTVSFYAKAGEIDVVSVGIRTSSGGYVSDPFSNQALTSEWQRFSGTFTATEDTHLVRFFFGSGAKTWSGDQGFYIWGTQIEVGSTASTYHRTEGQPYYGEGATPKGLLIEEQRANLLTDSDNVLDRFSHQNSTETNDQVLSPNGTVSGDSLVPDTNNASHTSFISTLSISASTSYAYSMFVKANGYDFVQLTFTGGFGNNDVWANFNLSTGATASKGSAATSSIEDYGNGWFRCVVIGTTGASATTGGPAFAAIGSDTASRDPSFAGDGTSGIFVWGAQLEQASFATSYIENISDAAGTTRNADVATMGPTTGGTELVTNGTFDTDSDWETGSGRAITGGEYVFTSASAYAGARPDSPLSIVTGRRYRISFECTSFTAGGFTVSYREGNVKLEQTSTVTSTGTYTLDFTCTDATDGPEPFIQATGGSTNTFAIDNVSVRELYPFEQYNPSEGTLYSESESTAEVLNSCVFVITDGTNNERVEIRHYGSTTGASRMEVVDGGVAQASISPTQASDFRRNALAYKANSVNAAGDGVSGTEDTNVSLPSPDEVLIGGSTFSVDYTGHIKRLSYYPRRLSDEAIENLTSD